MNITICGGGRIGHLLAIRFASKGANVNVLTQNPLLVNRFNESVGPWTLFGHNKEVLCWGRPKIVTSDPKIALKDSDIILLTAPSNAHVKMVREIAPFLSTNKKTFLGAMPGCGGFDWRCRNALGDRNDVVIWAFKDVSHISSNLDHGRSVLEGGAKSKLFIALENGASPEDDNYLHEQLSQLFDSPIQVLSNFIEITLTPGNALMHPPVLYDLAGSDGNYGDGRIYPGLEWWEDISPEAAALIEACDHENQSIKQSLEQHYGLCLDSVCSLSQELKVAYGSLIGDSSTMYRLLSTNKAYKGIEFPSINKNGLLIPNPSSRVFFEDIEIGQAVLIAMGKRLRVPTPNIEKIHTWGLNWHAGLRDLTNQIVPKQWLENL